MKNLKIFKVDFRGLAGAGARFKLTRSKMLNDYNFTLCVDELY